MIVMATIRKEIRTRACPDAAWDAMRDIGALHERLVVGFVVDTELDGNARIVKFANGMEAREVIVGIDEQARRLAYSVVGGSFTHHNASAEIVADGDGSRVIWTADLLPDEIAGNIEAMMEQGAQAMKRTLDRA
jgi:carbon monoxide dehydrogenase subunit G